MIEKLQETTPPVSLDFICFIYIFIDIGVQQFYFTYKLFLLMY